MRRLPPLGALRAFEAAARQLNFTRAGEELFVTQAAISHQVRQLEAWLGVTLFTRRGHALALTDAGMRYLAGISVALDQIATVTAQICVPADRPLSLTVLPSFAACWLASRLGGFRAHYPDLEVRLKSDASLWNFADDRFDFGIRSGLGAWPGLTSVLIAPEALTPLCTPDVAARLGTPADLLNVPLISDTPKDGWTKWLAAAGVSGKPAFPPVIYDDAALVLQEATRSTEAVALGRRWLAADDLAAGRLVQPFTLQLPNDYSYWLVWREAERESPQAVAFRSWLLAAAASR
jgi:LysR family glycine cleavage system transcriptional activator